MNILPRFQSALQPSVGGHSSSEGEGRISVDSPGTRQRRRSLARSAFSSKRHLSVSCKSLLWRIDLGWHSVENVFGLVVLGPLELWTCSNKFSYLVQLTLVQINPNRCVLYHSEITDRNSKTFLNIKSTESAWPEIQSNKNFKREKTKNWSLKCGNLLSFL